VVVSWCTGVGCLPALLLSVGWGVNKEGSEGGGMGAVEVSEEVEGDCCHQVTANQ